MKKLLGGILLAVGILIAGASGLCSLVMLVTSLVGQWGGILSMLALILFFGGIPIALGVALIIGGRALLRQDRETHEDPDDVADTFR